MAVWGCTYIFALTFATTTSTCTVSKLITVLFCRCFQSQIQRWVTNTTWNADYAITGKWWCWGTTNRREGRHTRTRGPVRGSAHVRAVATATATTTSVAAWQHQRQEPGGRQEGGHECANAAWAVAGATCPSSLIPLPPYHFLNFSNFFYYLNIFTYFYVHALYLPTRCWYTSSVYDDENNQNNNIIWGATEECVWVSNPSYNEWDEIISEFYEVRNVR